MSGKRTVRLDGATIARLRVERGLTVEELAAKAGHSVRTVQNIENGKPVFMFTAGNIAQALGVGPADLMLDPFPAPIRQRTWEITLRITTPFDEFDASDDLVLLVKTIARRLGGEDEMEPKRIKPGSTSVTLDVTTDQLMRILKAFGKGELNDLGVTLITAPNDIKKDSYHSTIGDQHHWAIWYYVLLPQLTTIREREKTELQ